MESMPEPLCPSRENMPTLANNPTEMRPCPRCGKESRFELVEWLSGKQEWKNTDRAFNDEPGVPSESCGECLVYYRKLRDMENLYGPAFLALTWATFQKTPDNQRAFMAAKDFKPTDDNLFLWGPCGVGKTHLLAALLHDYPRAKFISAIELSRQFRKLDPETERALLKEFREVEILAVDDIGVGRATEFSNQILYEIIEARIRWGKNGLILTTNYSPEALAEKMGDDRLASRLAGLCRVIEIKGEDWRLKKGK